MSEYKNRPFLARLGCALQGLAHGVRSERSLRVQLLALAAALAALGILRPGALWCALVLLSAAVVLAEELFNTAIERLADELHPGQHPGIRIAKDCAAAGVLVALPFADLILRAQRAHRAHHAPNTVQMSTLLSIKTGACPEDCAYCPQSVRYDTGLAPRSLMEVAAVRECAAAARAAGATRFCMGAAYRSPKARDLKVIAEMIRAVREAGLESCATLGMLTPEQAAELKAAGLDYYNHNLDTSAEFYGEIITTRTYQDRLDTLQAVRAAGLKVCCGG